LRTATLHIKPNKTDNLVTFVSNSRRHILGQSALIKLFQGIP